MAENSHTSLPNYELFEKLLKAQKASLTTQRRLVFTLLHHPDPQSMAELYKRCEHHIDRASLYRIIELFEKLGIVQRVSMGWKYKLELSDLFSAHHHHLTCMNCQRMIAIEEEPAVENLIAHIAAAQHFKPVKHQLEIQGYCSSCTQANTN